jgi:predicted metal-dependent hydrolase
LPKNASSLTIVACDLLPVRRENPPAMLRILNTQTRTKEEFKDRVLAWAAKLEVRVRLLALRPMKNKWASCSTNGNLSFNVELLGMDRKVGEYVIVHELLHFSVPNHGKLWKSLMRAHLGNYGKAEERLKHIGAKKACVTEPLE